MSISWNYDGTIFASASKDKGMRIIDPRAKKTVQVFHSSVRFTL